MKESKKNKIAFVLGSARFNSYTSKVLALVRDEFKKDKTVEVHLIDPTKINLNLLFKEDSKIVKKIQNIVRQATGVILATPEYHGSYSSTIKLIIDNLGYPSVLSGKPVMLLGVASGQIGAVKAIEHLRSVCAHVGAIVLPGAVSVAKVDRLFDGKGRCLDRKMEERIRLIASNLLDYVRVHT